MILRDADPSDLDAVYDVWYATEIVGLPNPPPPRTMPWFGHLLDVGRLVVAEERGAVVGFAGLLDLGSCVALSDLFVRPDRQSHGVGAALLDEVLPGGRPCVTMASADPRAIASYARRGMRPRWPAYYLSATAGQVRRGPVAGARRPGAGPRRVRLAACRATCRTTARSVPDRWPSTGRACGWARRWSSTAARSASSTPTPPRCWRRPSTTRTMPRPSCWPSSPTSSKREPPASWSRCQGPHGALAPLLERGFAITDVDTACASEEGCWPTRPATRCTASHAWRPRRRAAGGLSEGG